MRSMLWLPRWSYSVLTLILALASPPKQAFAQVEPQNPVATLLGTLVDSAGQGIAGVEVFLTRTDFAGFTNTDGRFLIPDIPIGRYLAALVFTHGASRRLYPELFPVHVGSAQTNVTIHLAKLSAERGLLDLDTDRDATLTTLSALGVELDERLAGLVEYVTPRSSRILGQVRDAASGRAIASAEVMLEGTTHRTLSDGRGRFVLADVSPGAYNLSVGTIGYAARREEIVLSGAESLDVLIDLSTEPIQLEPIVVEARSQWLSRVGFYERRDDPGNFGRIITRHEIENRGYTSVADLFYRIPGARVDYAEVGRRAIKFRRVVGTQTGDGCTPPMYLDGMRVADAWDIVPPEWIEAVEVYVGGASTPMQYRDPCGVVLIWTRRGS